MYAPLGLGYRTPTRPYFKIPSSFQDPHPTHTHVPAAAAVRVEEEVPELLAPEHVHEEVGGRVDAAREDGQADHGVDEGGAPAHRPPRRRLLPQFRTFKFPKSREKALQKRSMFIQRSIQERSGSKLVR